MFQAPEALVIGKAISFETVTVTVVIGNLLVTRTVAVTVKVVVAGRTLDSVIVARATRASLDNW